MLQNLLNFAEFLLNFDLFFSGFSPNAAILGKSQNCTFNFRFGNARTFNFRFEKHLIFIFTNIQHLIFHLIFTEAARSTFSTGLPARSASRSPEARSNCAKMTRMCQRSSRRSQTLGPKSLLSCGAMLSPCRYVDGFKT